jgi:hypothetical protein
MGMHPVTIGRVGQGLPNTLSHTLEVNLDTSLSSFFFGEPPLTSCKQGFTSPLRKRHYNFDIRLLAALNLALSEAILAGVNFQKTLVIAVSADFAKWTFDSAHVMFLVWLLLNMSTV